MNRHIVEKLEDIVNAVLKTVDRDTYYTMHTSNLAEYVRKLLMAAARAAYNLGYHDGQQTVTPDHR